MTERVVFSNYQTKYNNQEDYHYSQAVKIGPLIKCSGQGGWDLEGLIDGKDFEKQMNIAFKNVERNLKAAGSRGWEDVIVVRTYHLDIAEQFPKFVECFRKWMPNHCPVWTSIEVKKLAIPGMLLEVEVEAYIL